MDALAALRNAHAGERELVVPARGEWFVVFSGERDGRFVAACYRLSAAGVLVGGEGATRLPVPEGGRLPPPGGQLRLRVG